MLVCGVANAQRNGIGPRCFINMGRIKSRKSASSNISLGSDSKIPRVLNQVITKETFSPIFVSDFPIKFICGFRSFKEDSARCGAGGSAWNDSGSNLGEKEGGNTQDRQSIQTRLYAKGG